MVNRLAASWFLLEPLTWLLIPEGMCQVENISVGDRRVVH